MQTIAVDPKTKAKIKRIATARRWTLAVTVDELAEAFLNSPAAGGSSHSVTCRNAPVSMGAYKNDTPRSAPSQNKSD